MAGSQVAIVVDSTATLPPEVIKQYQFHVIPQILNWEGKTYKDGVDITPDEFYSRLKVAKEMPTTSQPSAGEFYEYFQQLAETSDSIVGVFISEHLSGTLDSAYTAADMMEDYPIEIVDSRSASMGLGFIALAAARAVEKGLGHLEAAQAARSLIPNIHVLFVVDTLEFLHRGGRIGGAQRLVGSVLSIKPVLHLDDGRIEPLASVRTKRKAIQYALDVVAEDTEGMDKIHTAILHASAPDEAGNFLEMVKNRFDPVEISLAELSPVIGAHVGPGLVGIAYYGED
jgi:DegV family protein with EDD domain